MEGLGPKLQQARLARGLTLDEAGRMTKIRPSKLAEIEAEDFSDFPSLAYAKGFVQIYGKFLEVDVSADLDAFETSNQVTVDGYSYLQETPEPQPQPRRVRPRVVERRAPRERGSLLPLIIGIVVLFVGFTALKFFLNVQRIKPRPETNAATTPAPSPAGQLVAPRALPADITPAPVAKATPPPAMPTTTPAVAAASIAPSATASEPEVRRAEPVRAEELAAATSATPGAVNKIEIRPLKKTYLKVVVDGKADAPAIERWVSTSDKSLRVSGQRVAIRALDPTAVQIRKNGKPVADGDPDVTIE
jgi:cytoskeletal protein RodZ